MIVVATLLWLARLRARCSRTTSRPRATTPRPVSWSARPWSSCALVVSALQGRQSPRLRSDLARRLQPWLVLHRPRSSRRRLCSCCRRRRLGTAALVAGYAATAAVVWRLSRQPDWSVGHIAALGGGALIATVVLAFRTDAARRGHRLGQVRAQRRAAAARHRRLTVLGRSRGRARVGVSSPACQRDGSAPTPSWSSRPVPRPGPVGQRRLDLRSARRATSPTRSATVAVRLAQPPPLDTAMDGGDRGRRDSWPASTARRSPGPRRSTPTWCRSRRSPAATARAAEATYPGLASHPFPTCFACGTGREPGDGLRIFPGPVGDRTATRVAATWTPHPSVADGLARRRARDVGRAVTWAALDCVGGWAADVGERPMVLGTDDRPARRAARGRRGARRRRARTAARTAARRSPPPSLYDADRPPGRAPPSTSGSPSTRRRSTDRSA